MTNRKIFTGIGYSLLMIAILLLFLYLLFSKPLRENPATPGLPNSTLTDWKDENNHLHTTVSILQEENSNHIREIDSLRRVLKLHPKQIISYSSTGTKFSIDAPITSPGDNSKSLGEGIYLSDPDDHISVSGDSIHISILDTLTRTVYWRRKCLIAPKDYYEDITNSNSHVQVTGYKGVLIHKEKPWSIGLGVQVGYPLNYPVNFRKPAITVGISVQKAIIRF